MDPWGFRQRTKGGLGWHGTMWAFGPKEISIFCPQNPQVRIVDLPSNEGDNDECMVLNLSAPDMNSRLVINCHGKRSAQRMSAEKTTAEQDERGDTSAES